jgi:hypothetical protein
MEQGRDVAINAKHAKHLNILKHQKKEQMFAKQQKITVSGKVELL